MIAEMTIGETRFLSETASITRYAEGYFNENQVLVEGIPGAMIPVVERNFFSSKIHEQIVEYVKSEAYFINPMGTERSENSSAIYQFNRKWATNDDFFYKIHEQLEEVASEIFGERVKMTYNFLSLYEDKGVCPYHTDRDPCKYTIDYCIDQDETWDIWVDDKPYTLEVNDALCYSGSDSPHFREKIKGKYCSLVFFHFMKKT